MKIWELGSTQLPLTAPKSSSQSTANSAYAKILAEKIADARTEMEQMDAVRDQLDEIARLQAELTGNASGTSKSKEVSIIRRFKPDGSILFLTVQDGKIVQAVKKKPHLVAVADPSAPLTPSGQTAIKFEIRPQLDLAGLLM